MKHLDVTLQAIEIHGLTAVLLRAKDKDPMSWCLRCEAPTRFCGHYPGTRRVTRDLDEIRAHGKIGVLGGARLTVLDVDRPSLFDQMCAALGPVLPTVRSGGIAEDGREKFHCWLSPVLLPRTFTWEGQLVGEIIGEGFYCTAPPAKHHKTGRLAEWIRDPRGPLPALPDSWRTYLTSRDVRPAGSVEANDLPDFIDPNDRRGIGDFPFPDAWDGPAADEIRAAALRQPGARERKDGSVKFQCAGCAAEGHDTDEDNARVWPDGRWGCALQLAGHRRAIGVQLGALEDRPPAPPAPPRVPWMGGLR